ncbi:monovalent cation/H(+) antiporter subunit G, partial [Dysosmobacter welbionis]
GAVIGNVFLQNLKARFLVVLEPGFRGLSGSECHSLLGMAENVRRRNRFLAQNVNTGGQRFQRGCSVFSCGHGGRIAAGYGFDRNHRIGDWFSGKCVRFDDFQIWEFLV